MSAIFIIFAETSFASQYTTASAAFDSFHKQDSGTAQTEWLVVEHILTMLMLDFESVQQSPDFAADSAGHRQPHTAGSGCTAAAVLLAAHAECQPGLFLHTLKTTHHTVRDSGA